MRDSHHGGSLPSLVPEAPTADDPTATRSEREGRWASRCHGVDGVPIDIVDATGRYNVCVSLCQFHLKQAQSCSIAHEMGSVFLRFVSTHICTWKIERGVHFGANFYLLFPNE